MVMYDFGNLIAIKFHHDIVGPLFIGHSDANHVLEHFKYFQDILSGIIIICYMLVWVDQILINSSRKNLLIT